jgi:hypothetical protein
MSINTEPTDAPEPVSDLEGLQYTFLGFMNAVEALAASPVAQCEWIGDHNVAWELRTDVAAGKYLIGTKFLSLDQERAVLALVAALDTIPAIVLPAAIGRDVNLKAMQHDCWSNLRIQASKVVGELGALLQVTEVTLGVAKNAP